MKAKHHNALFMIVIFTTMLTWWDTPSAAPLQVSSELRWQAWTPAVFKQAQQQGRLVLLDLTAKWCQFCKKMDAITYHDPRVVDLISRKFLPVRADEADYPKLARRYEKDGRPLTVVFTADGTELIKRRGYLQPQFMVWMLEAVAQQPDAEAHR